MQKIIPLKIKSKIIPNKEQKEKHTKQTKKKKHKRKKERGGISSIQESFPQDKEH